MAQGGKSPEFKWRGQRRLKEAEGAAGQRLYQRASPRSCPGWSHSKWRWSKLRASGQGATAPPVWAQLPAAPREGPGLARRRRRSGAQQDAWYLLRGLPDASGRITYQSNSSFFSGIIFPLEHCQTLG